MKFLEMAPESSPGVEVAGEVFQESPRPAPTPENVDAQGHHLKAQQSMSLGNSVPSWVYWGLTPL